MKRKPVSIGSVILCLILVLGIVATLFLPIFSMNLNIGGANPEYINITGLDIIKSLFVTEGNFASQTDTIKTLVTFLGQGTMDISQYINPMFINVAIISYCVAIICGALMLIFTILNFAGIRVSVVNVFAGLITFVCGVITTVTVLLQNGEFVENILVKYDFKIAFGVIILIVAGFSYMMFAPKKRV